MIHGMLQISDQEEGTAAAAKLRRGLVAPILHPLHENIDRFARRWLHGDACLKKSHVRQWDGELVFEMRLGSAANADLSLSPKVLGTLLN